jgi:MFS family permease
MGPNDTGATRRNESRSAWRTAVRGNVLMMGLVSLFTDFSSEMINPLLPIFFAGLVGGAKAAFWVGLSEGIAETTAAILKIFSGRISDRLGKRKILVVGGYGLSTLARPAIALASAAWHVVALKFADRVGKGLRTSPRDALIGDSVGDRHRGLAFSFHRAMDHTGAVLGPAAVIVLLYALLGYAKWGEPYAEGTVPDQEMHAMRLLFGVALIPGVPAMLALIFKVREIAPRPAQTQSGADPVAGMPSPSLAPAASVWKQLPGRFYSFVAIVTLFALGNSSDMFLLLYAWELFDMGLIPVVLLWIVLHLSKIAFSIPGGVLSDRLGRRPLLLAGWTAYALVYLGFAFVHQGSMWQFWALFVAYGVYYGLTEGVEKALVTDFVPSAYRGTAFGIYHFAVGMAALPASLIFGVFWQRIGPRLAFGIGAALAGAAALLLAVLLSTEVKHGRSAP